MFGYLKPYNEELKQRSIREYKQMYCGLCYGLRKNYGVFSSILLSNECTFLFIFLDALLKNNVSEETSFRCPINPFQRISVGLNQTLLSYVSFINYHLSLLSIRDHYIDSKGGKRWIFKIIYLWMKRRKQYKRQLPTYAIIADKITSACNKLNLIEAEKDSTYDDCSQQMGMLLTDIVKDCPILDSEDISIKALELARHIGMWVYLIDAYDDLKKDVKHGDFNPLMSFIAKDNENTVKTCTQLGELMLNLMYSNLCSLTDTIHYYRHNEIIENIIIYGTCHSASIAKRKFEKGNEKHGKTAGK